VVCIGCGGVGKTSVASTLAVTAARAGKRVLALTVDPSGRLADSLGVERDRPDYQPLSDEKLSDLGIAAPGALSVGILDPQQTLYELVARASKDEAARDRILAHPLFRFLSDYLAGANEYMAMERLLQTLGDERFDLVVLDTPPTRHALDFLSAPERFSSAVNGPVVRALARAAKGGTGALDWVSRTVARVIRGLGKLAGDGTLEQLTTLLWELNVVFGDFDERVRRIGEAFRSPSFAYVLVTRLNRVAADDAHYVSQSLRAAEMRADLLVVNRVETTVNDAPLAAGLSELEQRVDSESLDSLRRAVRFHQELIIAQSECLAELLRDGDLRRCPRVMLPAVAGGVLGLAQLGQLADALETAPAG